MKKTCQDGEAIAIIESLLSVMPAFPKDGNKIIGFKEKYDHALKRAKEYRARQVLNLINYESCNIVRCKSSFDVVSKSGEVIVAGLTLATAKDLAGRLDNEQWNS